MQNEISAGLKNAIERGSTLEAAVQTFIRAGYNPEKVKVAALAFSSSGTSTTEMMNSPAQEESYLPQLPSPEEKKEHKALLILIIIIALLVLIGSIGYLLYILLA
jgi:hypothetical protein